MYLLFLTTILFISINGIHGLINVYPKYQSVPAEGDVGEPLFLTPYIESGQIKEGRRAARVHLNGTNVRSYSGFITVNQSYNSNVFLWFFPAETNYTAAPVVVWLQGGPGSSSLFGLFAENGPFYVTKEQELKPRNIYWSQIVNTIYIDNPVGTGYSFTENDAGYATNEVDVGRDLFSTISQFLDLFPELQLNDFYITGESYAGKYIPAFAYTIHINNINSTNKINLKGMAIGDGWCDPEHMMVYGDYLYQIGLIDYNEKLEFNKREKEIVECIKQKEFVKAADYLSSLIMDDYSYFYNITGFKFYFNLLYVEDYSPYGDEGIYLQKQSVRRSIHVGNLTYNSGDEVRSALIKDFSDSIKPWLEILVENYKIVLFNGELDIIVGYPLTVNYLNFLNWSGAEEYKTASRKQWYVNEELAGYSKTVRNLIEILVRNAGHMVCSDQPKWAFEILRNLVTNQKF